MDTLQERILELITNGRPGTYNTHTLSEALQMESASDFVLLNKALNHMEEAFVLVRDGRNRFLLPAQADIITGTISVNKKGYGFLDREEGSIYIPQERMGGALDRDTVAVKCLSGVNAGEGEVVRVLRRNTQYLIGTFESVKGTFRCELDDERVKGTVKVTNLKDFKIVNGIKAQLKIVSLGRVNQLSIVKLLGHKDDPGVDILSVLLEYGIEAEFPEDVKKQVAKMAQELSPKDLEGRKDCRDLVTVTIDGDDSKDFDDAVSIQKENGLYRLYVHIADVAHYVQENTPLDQEARRRGTSTYVTDRVVPMLPFELSDGICSLNPKEDRLTLTCEMIINPQGKIKHAEIYPSVICSNERMTYHNVNLILDQDPKMTERYKALGSFFFDLYECSKLIRTRRTLDGCLEFETDEAKIQCDKNGKPYAIVLRERDRSEAMIEDFMICANESVAHTMHHQELPALYRIHEEPTVKKMREFVKITTIFGNKYKGPVESPNPKDIQACLDSFKDTEEYPIIATMMLRTMSKARYDSHEVGHFGLALKEYLHFTSPIRRYPDLIVHRMLHKYVFNQVNDPQAQAKDAILMEDLGVITSERERASVEAEREVDDMKMAEYMEGHVGEVFEGVISSITKFGIFVQLPNLVEGLVRLSELRDDFYVYLPDSFCLMGERTGHKYRLGDPMKVKCSGASKDDRTIDFMPVLTKVQKKRKETSNRKRRVPRKGGRRHG